MARVRALLPVADVARQAGKSPRQMRRILEAMNRDCGGKLLVRVSDAPRAKQWVNIRVLKSTGADWVGSVEEPLDADRVRELVHYEIDDVLDAVRKLHERVDRLEKYDRERRFK
jgi:hypothetical protein